MVFNPIAAADSILPVFDWDNPSKRAYLSYKACGFSSEEARKYVGVNRTTVYRWRKEDATFYQLDVVNLGELRTKFRKEVVQLEFTRNFKLVLEKDFRVLHKAVTEPKTMTKEDTEYLHRIRPMYTPQQLIALENIVSVVDQLGSWDELLVYARRHNAQAQSNGNEVSSGPQEYQESTALTSGSTGDSQEEQ